MRVDPDKLSQQLVRSLRGEQTQSAASKSLGFGSNVIYAWETGRRAPELSRLIRLAELSDSSIHRRLRAFFKSPAARLRSARLSTPRGVQFFIEELIGNSVRSEVAEKAGVDRTTLTRWLQGKTEPRVPEVLKLVDICTQRVLPFVECFSDPAQLEETRDAWNDLRAQAKLAYDFPWSHALLRALELDSYRTACTHDPEILARSLCLSPEKVTHYLSELEKAGQIVWRKTHYEAARILTVDTREDPEKDRALKAHWAKVSLNRLETGRPHPEAYFSYNLFAISEANFEKVRQLHLEYYNAVRSLVDTSETADRVVVMNAHLVPLGETQRDED